MEAAAPAASVVDEPSGPAIEVVDPGGDAAVEPEGTATPAARRRRRRRRGGRGRTRAGASSPDGASAEAALLTAEDAEPIAADEAEEAPRAGKARTPKSATARRQAPKRDAAAEAAAPEPAATERPARAPRSRSRSRAKVATVDTTAIAVESEAAAPAGEPAKVKTARRRASAERAPKAEPAAPVQADQADKPARATRTRKPRGMGRRRREAAPALVRSADKTMLVTEVGERDQIAVLEDRVLVEHFITRAGARSMVGNIYLSKVQNVLPGMEAAFLDIGRGRNAVLYAGEVSYDEEIEGDNPRIEQALKSGQKVLVQVTKDPMGGKGPRLTQEISLPGRYLVLVPKSGVFGVSRRLPDAERGRLKDVLKKIKPPEHGLIVRTAAEGASGEELRADLERLTASWTEIEK